MLTATDSTVASVCFAYAPGPEPTEADGRVVVSWGTSGIHEMFVFRTLAIVYRIHRGHIYWGAGQASAKRHKLGCTLPHR